MSGDKGIQVIPTESLINQAALICPRCRGPQRESQLELDDILHQQGNTVIEGFLACRHTDCAQRFPILYGVPVVFRNMAEWWQGNRILHTCSDGARELKDYFNALDRDNPARLQARRLLSTYLDAHFSAESDAFWHRLLKFLEIRRLHGRSVDLGCSVGRFTFELATVSELAIGIDSNLSYLAAAARMQRDHELVFQHRTSAGRFRQQHIQRDMPKNVLFVAADVLDPPFTAESFNLVAGLNVLDNVRTPLILIGQMDALLKRKGYMVLSSPYEWREDITQPGEWLENDLFEAPEMVRKIMFEKLIPEMALDYLLVRECDAFKWNLRHHARYFSQFSTHVLKAQKG